MGKKGFWSVVTILGLLFLAGLVYVIVLAYQRSRAVAGASFLVEMGRQWDAIAKSGGTPETIVAQGKAWAASLPPTAPSGTPAPIKTTLTPKPVAQPYLSGDLSVNQSMSLDGEANQSVGPEILASY